MLLASKPTSAGGGEQRHGRNSGFHSAESGRDSRQGQHPPAGVSSVLYIMEHKQTINFGAGPAKLPPSVSWYPSLACVTLIICGNAEKKAS